ncbi:MAG: hypothetical protein ACTSVW_07150 [Candidatus Njordarchaeales archaeon]
MTNWLEWFSFIADPFVTRPLQSEAEFNDFFVKTSSIEKEFAAFVNQVKLSPFLRLVVGKRGMGKSTALQYAIHMCRKSDIVAVYIGLYPYGIKRSKEPVFEIARQLMHTTIQELICSLYEVKNKLFLKNKSLLVKWGKYIGLSFDEFDGFIRDPTLRPDFEMLKDVVFGFLDFMKHNKIPMLVAIDNLDKLDINTVKAFLKGAASQPLFEKLNACGASVLIAADPELAQEAEKDPDLNFLKQKIQLEPLSPVEAEDLIARRIKKYSVEKSRRYYEPDAIIYVCNEKEGVIRDILNEMRGLFIKAFNEGKTYISLEFAKTGSERLQEIETYYDIIKDEYARKGAEKLLRVNYLLPKEKTKEMPKILDSIYRQEYIKIPIEIIQTLLEAEVIFSNESLPSGYNLDFNVYQLLNEVRKREWPVKLFIKWILRPDTVELVRIQTPGFRAKQIIEQFVNKIQVMHIKKSNVSVVQNETKTTYAWKKWHGDIIQKIKRAKENYDIIDNIDMEDTDKSMVYQQLYYILKDFLLVFAKCFAAIREENISFKSKTSYIDNWEFIRSAILAYQRDKNVNFKSYRFIWQIRTNNTAIRRKTFSPTEEDIKEALKNLESVIVEFSKELDNILAGHVREIAVLEKAEPEFHEALRFYVDKLAERMGYTEDLDSYRIFKVNGHEYVKMHFYKSPTNTAELDIVRRKKEIERRDGKIRHHYFIAEVKRVRREVNEKEILLFLKKCEDLIKILESETSQLPQILKPKYTIWYISYSGFTNKARRVFSRTRRPSRTNYELISIKELNKKLSEYGLKKYSV